MFQTCTGTTQILCENKIEAAHAGGILGFALNVYQVAC